MPAPKLIYNTISQMPSVKLPFIPREMTAMTVDEHCAGAEVETIDEELKIICNKLCLSQF